MLSLLLMIKLFVILWCLAWVCSVDINQPISTYVDELLDTHLVVFLLYDGKIIYFRAITFKRF